MHVLAGSSEKNAVELGELDSGFPRAVRGLSLLPSAYLNSHVCRKNRVERKTSCLFSDASNCWYFGKKNHERAKLKTSEVVALL